MLELLKRGLGVAGEQIYMVPGLLGKPDLDQLVGRTARAQGRALDPGDAFALRETAAGDDLYAEIRQANNLVHHPYHSFASSFEGFVESAAKDQDVVAIKTTVYRTDEDSPLVPALIGAAEEGMQSVCLVELKPASTSTATSNGRARWNRPASTSSTGCRTSRCTPR